MPLWASARLPAHIGLSPKVSKPYSSACRLPLPTAAFPPAAHNSLPEGRAAFPHAKRGGNGQPAHIPPSEQKTLFLHVDKEKQKSFGKASLFRPCRLTSFGEPHIFAL